MIWSATGEGCTPSANTNVCAALGATSVAAVQLSALGVVHAGVVALASPKAAGLAMISAKNRLMLTGTMSTLSDVRPACSVELNKFESAVNGAAGCDRPNGVCPISGKLNTMIMRAP